MPRLGLDDLIFPLLMEKEKERKTESRRQDRAKRIAELYQTVLNPKGADKTGAAGELASLGASVPMNMLQGRPDLSFAKLPPEVQAAYDSGAIDAEKALTIGWKMGDKVEFTPETAEQLSAASGRPGEGQKLYSIYKLTEYLGKEGASSFMGGGAAKEPTDAEVKRGLLDKAVRDDQGNLIPFPELGPERKLAYFAAGGSNDELLSAYGVNTKAVTEAQNGIYETIKTKIGMEAWQGLGDLMAQWQGGDTKLKSSTIKLLDKYFDKTTGELKSDVVMAKAKEVMDLAVEGAEQPKKKKPADWPGTQADWEDYLRLKGQ
jgi:hypothetical protein